MWFLVNAFARTGIQSIEGDIIVDSSLFDQAHFDESRQKERVDRAYDAPVSAMSFNWNSINVFNRAGDQPGTNGSVFLDPESDYAKLSGKILTVKENSLKDGLSHISVERQPSESAGLVAGWKEAVL